MSKKIAIIGAGVSGLVAAIELDHSDCTIDIYDKNQNVGGRVRSDYIDDYPFDIGFQALLTGYPLVKEYLDLEQLNIIKFLPGAEVVYNNRRHLIGDPSRKASFLSSAIDTTIASISDKIKTLQLSRALKQKSIEAIFSSKSSTTRAYLEQYGFSKKIIERFFTPFFGGIFLEKELRTSSRIFEFVFKMFAEGYSSIPAYGIQSVSMQLKSKIKNATFFLGQGIKKVNKGKIVLEGGSTKEYDVILIAHADHKHHPKKATIKWKGCCNLYYEVSSKRKPKKMISLIADSSKLINNYHFPTDLHPIGNKKRILSVTVIDHKNLEEEELSAQVIKELKAMKVVQQATLLKAYWIPTALPDLHDIKYLPDDESLQLSDHLYTAGDHLAMGSLNAAMASGKRVAQLIKDKEL